jgi:hypothetical protein
VGKKESYRNLFGDHLPWRRFYIMDYFFDRGYSARVVAKLNDNGERGYRSFMELRQAGNLPQPVAASLDLSGYDEEDPDEAIQALELLLLFQ